MVISEKLAIISQLFQQNSGINVWPVLSHMPMPEPIILVRELVIWVATESYPIELESFAVV